MTRNIIGSIKLEPDATPPTAAAGVIYFDSGDTKLKVSEDGATFVDVGTGGGGTYDAIVDAAGGADYTTLGAAVTAGALNIFLKAGTTTEVGAIVLSASTRIVGESLGAIVNMGNNQLTVGDGNILDGFIILSSYTARQIVLVSGGQMIQNMVFINNHTSNPGARNGMIDDNAAVVTFPRIDNCIFEITNTATDTDNRQAINQENVGSYGWMITNCMFFGQATTTRISGIRLFGSQNIVSDCVFKDFGEQFDAFISSVGGGNRFSNITAATSIGRIYLGGNYCSLSGLSTDQDVDVIVDADGCVVSNCATGGTLEVFAVASQLQVTGCGFDLGIILAGDSSTISACRAGALAGGGGGTITISSGGDNNIISNCMVDVVLVDGGTGNVTDSVVY